jgi:hypothetical protein
VNDFAEFANVQFQHTAWTFHHDVISVFIYSDLIAVLNVAFDPNPHDVGWNAAEIIKTVSECVNFRDVVWGLRF